MKLAVLCEEYMPLALRHHIFPIDVLLDEPDQIGKRIRKGLV